MKQQQPTMRPQDIVVLLKIILFEDKSWNQLNLSEELYLSQSEISQSISRSKYAGLLDPKGRHVRRLALMNFLNYGVEFVFPQQPGAVVRGFPTAHSVPPLTDTIQSGENYVWPTGKGTLKGQSIVPLYPGVIDACRIDSRLHEVLALVDAIRVGRAREKEIAVNELKNRILNAKQDN